MVVQKKFKILLLEDNPADAELLTRELTRSAVFSFKIDLVDTRDAFIEKLESNEHDIVLSDHSLPNFSSLEAHVIVKNHNPNLPFILVTGSVSEHFAVDCIKAGVDDYVLKQSLTRLPSAILNAWSKKQAEMERENNLKKLLKANQELKTFIYRASHDIRGPICSLKGLINVSKYETETNEFMKLMGYMDKGVNRLDDVLMNLIETLELKDRILKREEINFEAIVNSILAEYVDLPVFHKLDITVNTSFNSIFFTDGAILRLIMKSVIDNAVKYHSYSREHPFIKITLAANENGLLIEVIDNGTGIQKEFTEKVFDMFFRANEQAEGFGLGLYLAKIACERLEGSIGINSEEGIGTKVKVFVPFENKSMFPVSEAQFMEN